MEMPMVLGRTRDDTVMLGELSSRLAVVSAEGDEDGSGITHRIDESHSHPRTRRL
jgi:hypothetical protein